jgi:hypothetical protein
MPLLATVVLGAALLVPLACGPRTQPLHVEDAVRIAIAALSAFESSRLIAHLVAVNVG